MDVEELKVVIVVNNLRQNYCKNNFTKKNTFVLLVATIDHHILILSCIQLNDRKIYSSYAIFFNCQES